MARVPYLSQQDLPQEHRAFYDQIAAQRGHVARPFEALLNSPGVASRVAALGEQLRYLSPTIASDVREIVTLTTAKALDCEYIWTHHCNSAKDSGVREEVVNAIKQGGRPRRLLPKESVFIQFAQELINNKRIHDATYSAVEHLLGRQGTVDLIITIGYYTMMCLAINGLNVELEEGVSPSLN